MKGSEVADIAERSDIPLHIVCDVRAEPVRWRNKFFVEDARIAAAEQDIFETRRVFGKAPDLIPGQRQ